MRARVRGERGAGEAVLGVDVRAGRGGGRGALLGAAQQLAGRAHHAAGVEPVVISRPQPDLQTHTMERVVSNSTPLKLACLHVGLCASKSYIRRFVITEKAPHHDLNK